MTSNRTLQLERSLRTSGHISLVSNVFVRRERNRRISSTLLRLGRSVKDRLLDGYPTPHPVIWQTLQGPPAGTNLPGGQFDRPLGGHTISARRSDFAWSAAV